MIRFLLAVLGEKQGTTWKLNNYGLLYKLVLIKHCVCIYIFMNMHVVIYIYMVPLRRLIQNNIWYFFGV